MNREKIIKLAVESGLHKRHTPENADEWWCFTSGIERFAAAIEAEQAETIAAQQARIAALVEALNFALVEYAPSNQGIIKRVLSEITDDLSALNEAKAQAIESLAGKIPYETIFDSSDADIDLDEWIKAQAQELRAKK